MKDILPGSAHVLPAYLTNVAGTLFFARDDGTTAGALEERRDRGRDRAGEGHPGRDRRAPTRLPHRRRGTLYFAADDGTHGDELWKSDGTEDGTVMVKDIWPDRASDSDLTDVGGTLFFAANDGTMAGSCGRATGLWPVQSW